MNPLETHETWLNVLFSNPQQPWDFAAITEIKKLREKVAELESKLAQKEKKVAAK
jgi:hypothetical protein